MKYISKDEVMNKLEILRGLVNMNQELVVSQAIQMINEIPTTADFTDKVKWVQDSIYSPSTDGDYLVFYAGYYNVFEYFHGKWFDHIGSEVKDTSDLWWQELPSTPRKG